MGSYRELLAYQKSFELAMEIFRLTKSFPKEETYSLIDQIRGSSRSANICIIEAYRKRRYPAHFISKLSDSDMENSETEGWLEFSLACAYLNQAGHFRLLGLSEEVGRLVQNMMNNPEKFGVDTN